MMSVGKMAAVSQVQTENGVSGLDDRGVGLHIGLRSGMRLNVGVLGAEELLGTVARQILDDIGVFAATVIAFAWVALGVLIRENRAHGFENRFADEILRCDQLQPFM